MTSRQTAVPPKILLIDDNAGDIRLITEALRAAVPGVEVQSVSDSTQAIPCLKAALEAEDSPNLVLLDLRMPKRSGLEVLEEIRKDPRMAYLPVVVLTSSEADQDVLRAYSLHANAVVTKPLDYLSLRATMKTLCEFWLEVARLPPAVHVARKP
jgi:CheY-like chemotaxis protein